MDAFDNTPTASQGSGHRGPFIPSLTLPYNKRIPFQVLDPTQYWGKFPTIKRHWPTVDGKYKAPIVCTNGLEYEGLTGGRCLACYGKEVGLLPGLDINSAPREEHIVPVYDHAKYSGRGKQARLVDPTIPINDPSKVQVGGLKLGFFSYSQFEKIRLINDSAQNLCRVCDGDMLKLGLVCSECETLFYSAHDMYNMSDNEAKEARHNSHPCPTCGNEAKPLMKRECNKCKGEEGRRIYDTVITGLRTKYATEGGDSKVDYSFSPAPEIPIVNLSSDQLREFFDIATTSIKGVPLDTQQRLLGIKVPESWQTFQTSTPQSRPYGA